MQIRLFSPLLVATVLVLSGGANAGPVRDNPYTHAKPMFVTLPGICTAQRRQAVKMVRELLSRSRLSRRGGKTPFLTASRRAGFSWNDTNH